MYKDLGGMDESVIRPVEFQPKLITRLREREIELSYFEKYTLQLEALSMKEIYRLIEERYLHDIELFV